MTEVCSNVHFIHCFIERNQALPRVFLGLFVFELESGGHFDPPPLLRRGEGGLEPNRVWIKMLLGAITNYYVHIIATEKQCLIVHDLLRI